MDIIGSAGSESMEGVRGSTSDWRSGVFEVVGAQKWGFCDNVKAAPVFGKNKKGLFLRSAALVGGCVGRITETLRSTTVRMGGDRENKRPIG